MYLTNQKKKRWYLNKTSPWTSREDDCFGVIDKVLAFGSEDARFVSSYICDPGLNHMSFPGIKCNSQEYKKYEILPIARERSPIPHYASGLGSNRREGMDVCKCITPLRRGGTLNSRLAACPLVRLVDGKERWEASDQPQAVLPQNCGGTEQNHSVTCKVLKTTDDDRRTTSSFPR
ncbi:hypothetical protein TNCV_773751 [Trichonephila clavipes]|nr:hypothetical protein TNCV_773751 [Trichonephila clavipes]